MHVFFNLQYDDLFSCYDCFVDDVECWCWWFVDDVDVFCQIINIIYGQNKVFSSQQCT